MQDFNTVYGVIWRNGDANERTLTRALRTTTLKKAQNDMRAYLGAGDVGFLYGSTVYHRIGENVAQADADVLICKGACAANDDRVRWTMERKPTPAPAAAPVVASAPAPDTRTAQEKSQASIDALTAGMAGMKAEREANKGKLAEAEDRLRKWDAVGEWKRIYGVHVPGAIIEVSDDNMVWKVRAEYHAGCVVELTQSITLGPPSPRTGRRRESQSAFARYFLNEQHRLEGVPLLESHPRCQDSSPRDVVNDVRKTHIKTKSLAKKEPEAFIHIARFYEMCCKFEDAHIAWNNEHHKLVLDVLRYQ